jgi:serine protease AprX
MHATSPTLQASPPGPRRTTQRLVLLLALLALLAGGVPPAQAAGTPADPETLEPALAQAVAARPDARYPVIVARRAPRGKAEERARAAEVEAEIAASGGAVRARLGLVNAHAATLTGQQVLRLARHPRVAGVSLDHAVALHQLATEPTTTGGTLLSTNTSETNAPVVWQSGNTGQAVGVAVLDSGVAPSADLANVVFGADVVTGATALEDKGGHGTHVAGIVAGNGRLKGGKYKGTAPAVKIVSVKVTTDDGRASYSSIITGLQWVVAHKDQYNIRVANLSLGATPRASYKDDPLAAAVEAAWFRGVVVVVSAGNRGPGPGTVNVPGNDPYVVTVGAMDDVGTKVVDDDLVPFWTSRGPTAHDGLQKPDVVASGRRVVSLRVPGSHLDRTAPDRVVDGDYFRLSGTSMAAPAVAGVAALVIAANPRLTPNQVKAALVRTARSLKLGDVGAQGAGMVDANAAVKLALNNPGTLVANAGLTPSRRFAAGVWPVLKTTQPRWRATGLVNGRTYVNGSWELSGLRNADGTWNDGGWDASAWANFDWENGGWDSARWSDGGWDAASWSDGGWDDGGWDNGGWSDGGWDDGGWDSALLP